ncbi:PIN domain-containing protein [Parapedobacter sp. DT-150]|uniref:PIN domain-containing protein n=1 Tax=Parapedobacter sp. DT-150 TaxID=3396162 RepID=UPI003F1C97CC
MRNKAFAVDTNVLIYLHDLSAPEKRAIANGLLADTPKIPSQVVSEYLNTCRRILDLSKDQLLKQSSGLLAGCDIIPVLPDTLAYAAELVLRYKFQLFDSVIVAAAIGGKCEVLYSEDMQHKLLVDKSITIINPFL